MYEERREQEEENEGFENTNDTLENVSEEASSDIPSDEITEEESGEEQEISVSPPEESIDSLRAELDRLRTELERRDQENLRMQAELGEFSKVFPDIGLETIPAEVWSSVKSGVPLAAAYALYEKKAAAYQKLTQSVNAKNSEQSSGAIGKESDSIYYSPSEVRKMSPAEVRAKYNIIIESMKKWN